MARSNTIARADVVKAAAFFGAWLVPIAISAYLGYPPTCWPTAIRDVTSVSCLFDERPSRHSSFYVQVRYEGAPALSDLDEGEYFAMQPFGHRNRFDRFMSRYGWRDTDELARRELAQWLAQRHSVIHPDQPRIVEVRYSFADTLIDGGPPPTGHFRKQRRSSHPPGALHVVGRPVHLEDP
jgi:hypothetical protein